MKLVIRTMVFHVICIIAFAFLYLNLSDYFYSEMNDSKTYLDFFMLSTTIQAGVGVTDIMPSSTYSKIAVIMQQLCMLLTHLLTLYVFTM